MAMEIEKACVLITLGLQDVQIWFDYEGEKVLAKPDKGDVRLFTKALYDGSLKFEFDSFSESMAYEFKEELPPKNGQTKELKFKLSRCNEEVEGLSIPIEKDKEIHQEEIHLVFPMINKALKNLEKQKARSFKKIEKVILVYTERDEKSQFIKNEPVGVFEILRPFLAEHFQLEPGDIIPLKITESDYKARTVDQLSTVRKTVAQNVFNQASYIKNTLKLNKVFASYRSGIPEICRVVHETFLYWFDSNFYDISSQEKEGRVEIEKFCPIESIKIKRKIKTLVEKGNFEGAWLLGKSLYESKGHPVVDFINDVYLLLAHGKNFNVNKHQNKEIVSFINNFFQQGMFSNSLRMAFRIEQYLMRNDWSNALTGIFTFRDLYGWELVSKHYSDDKNVPALSIVKNEFYVELARKKLKELKLADEWPQLKNKKKIEFGKMLERRDKNNEKEKRFLLEILLEKIENQRALSLIEAIKGKNGRYNWRLRQTRNAVTHGSAKFKDIEHAMKKLQNLQLLEKNDNSWSFLSAKEIQFSYGIQFDEKIKNIFDNFQHKMIQDIENFHL